MLPAYSFNELGGASAQLLSFNSSAMLRLFCDVDILRLRLFTLGESATLESILDSLPLRELFSVLLSGEGEVTENFRLDLRYSFFGVIVFIKSKFSFRRVTDFCPAAR